MTFCTDMDLLYWEPDLFNTAAAAAQKLVSGIATLSGTTVTVALVSLSAAQVRPMGVISFSGSEVKGSYPIVSVDSATTLTISTLYDKLFTADGTPSANPPSHVGGGENQAYAIRTFYPQRRIVTQMLLQAAGLDPSVEESADSVTNPDSLRRACALGTLQMIYSALAASAEEPAVFTARASMYERLYRRAMGSARVEIDTDGDGKADVTQWLGAMRMVRG